MATAWPFLEVGVDMWDETVVVFRGKEVVKYHYREFFIGRIRNNHQKLTHFLFIFDFRIGTYEVAGTIIQWIYSSDQELQGSSVLQGLSCL